MRKNANLESGKNKKEQNKMRVETIKTQIKRNNINSISSNNNSIINISRNSIKPNSRK